jgi:hypothetical protein
MMPDIPDDPVLVKYKFQRAIVVNKKKYVKLHIEMLINGLNLTRILIALVLVLLLNSFLYCPRAAHSRNSFSKSTLTWSIKTSYYKVLLSEHSIYSYKRSKLKE